MGKKWIDAIKQKKSGNALESFFYKDIVCISDEDIQWDDLREEYNNSPAGILLKDAPMSRELEHQMWDVDACDDPYWWIKMTYEEAIQEVQEIADKYRIGSGFAHGEGIEDGCGHTKRELKELKSVIRHMKKVYKKVSAK